MCGIVGFAGRVNAVPVLLGALNSLEYRGYDSSGIAFFDKEDAISRVKVRGNIANLEKAVRDRSICTLCGIGHTRWATHGAPTTANAHPHGTCRVQIVHNGIIENHSRIKEFLTGKGYSFESETDTEVCALLMDYWYGLGYSPAETIARTGQTIEGSYGICALFDGFPGTIFAFRKGSPLVAAPSENGNFIASDISALAEYSDRYCSVEEDEIACVTSGDISFLDMNGSPVSKSYCSIGFAEKPVVLSGYNHYMQKEIYEGARGVRRTLEDFSFDPGDISFSQIHIIACGTSYNAGLAAAFAMEKMTGIGVRVHIASEFRYYTPAIDGRSLCIFISQSGETADTLAALNIATGLGARVVALVNSPLSAMAQEAQEVILTKAGPEISVASTKAFTCQVAALTSLTVSICHSMDIAVRNSLSPQSIADKLKITPDIENSCGALAGYLAKGSRVFFIGRGVDYALCCEASLKAREVSYIDCHPYPAGELKHGTIALIEEGTPVVAIITDTDTADKTLANISEVRARGARVYVIATEDITISEGMADYVIRIPGTEKMYIPLVCAPCIQLLAYYMALEVGANPDRPRNLAKSVTVE